LKQYNSICPYRLLASFSLNDIASGSEDGTIKIWDEINDKLKYIFDKSIGGHANWVVN
jgi:hypothetical protein